MLNEQLEEFLADDQTAEKYLSVFEYEDYAATTMSLL